MGALVAVRAFGIASKFQPAAGELLFCYDSSMSNLVILFTIKRLSYDQALHASSHAGELLIPDERPPGPESRIQKSQVVSVVSHRNQNHFSSNPQLNLSGSRAENHHQIAHRRMAARREILRNHGRNYNSQRHLRFLSTFSGSDEGSALRSDSRDFRVAGSFSRCACIFVGSFVKLREHHEFLPFMAQPPSFEFHHL